MTAVLELNNISKKYGKLQVLSGASIKIKKGEIVCLLGPSGSGKTTLFRIAAGLINADCGEVYREKDLRQSFVFQHSRLLPWKTVEENIVFVQENFITADKAQKIRHILLELNGLGEFKDSYPAQLSGGMKQRLEIIRALSIDPDLLLMDEPFKSIDTQLKINLREMILRFHENSGLSSLFITHDPEEAIMMADHIYILSGQPGRVIKEFQISQPPSQRSLQEESLYMMLEEIIELFRELVDEYRWEKGKETKKILDGLNS
ncbi:MAG: ABC transporter ATP-binding protein [Bacillota bacterium]